MLLFHITVSSPKQHITDNDPVDATHAGVFV